MKKILLITLFILLSINFIYADIPYLINYRGNLLENDSPVTGTKSINFQIYNVPSGSAPLWESEAKSLNVINGAIAYTLGLDNPSAFSNINWKSQPIYLQIVVEGNPLLPRERIGSVGYSMVAQEALFVSSSNVDLDGVSGKKLSDWVTNSGRIKGSKIDGLSNSVFQKSGSKAFYTNGNVGIGTSNPINMLQLNNDTAPPSIRFVSSGSPSVVGMASNNQFFVGASTGDFAIKAPDNRKLHLGVDNGLGTTTPAITVIKGGNVGIGTNSPTEKLEVDGNVKANGIIESVSGGIKFPDGTIQTTKASNLQSAQNIYFCNELIYSNTLVTGVEQTLNLSPVLGNNTALVLLRARSVPPLFGSVSLSFKNSNTSVFSTPNLAVGGTYFSYWLIIADSNGEVIIRNTGGYNSQVFSIRIIAYIKQH